MLIIKSQNPRSVRAREALSEALIVLLETKPLEKISISEISKQAGLSRLTFYNHYENKNELLHDLIKTRMEATKIDMSIKKTINWLSATPDWDKENADIFFINYWYDNRDFLKFIFTHNMDSLLVNSLKELHKSNLTVFNEDEGVDLCPELADYLITFSCLGFVGILRVWTEGGFRESSLEISKMAYQLLWIPTGKMVKKCNGKM